MMPPNEIPDPRSTIPIRVYSEKETILLCAFAFLLGLLITTRVF
jgi:hypothetical protein